MPDERPEGSPDEPEDLDRPPPFFPYDESAPVPEGPVDYGEPVPVQVSGVYAADSGQQVQRFVLLTDEERRLPIVIGPFEALSISMALEGTQPDRPITHDLVKTILERLDCSIERVVIDDLWGSTYYAKVYVRRGEEEFEIDSRPSDAIALAVRFEASIFVADGIMEQGGG